MIEIFEIPILNYLQNSCINLVTNLLKPATLRPDLVRLAIFAIASKILIRTNYFFKLPGDPKKGIPLFGILRGA